MQGMKFNGYTEYLQLPSIQMDSIEIECLIDSTQPQANPFFLDARGGLSNGFFTKLGNIGSGWTSSYINGVLDVTRTYANIPKDTKFKIRLEASTFTDDVTIFNGSSFSLSNSHKATLYTVKCYLAGVIQCAYDFINNDTAIDVSGNGRNGTLVGGVPVVRKSNKPVRAVQSVRKTATVRQSIKPIKPVR